MVIIEEQPRINFFDDYKMLSMISAMVHHYREHLESVEYGKEIIDIGTSYQFTISLQSNCISHVFENFFMVYGKLVDIIPKLYCHSFDLQGLLDCCKRYMDAYTLKNLAKVIYE